MLRLTDAQVIDMAMASQNAKLGAFLGSVASTNIERSWARVMQHSDRGDPTAATQEAQQLLRLLGEEELARLNGSDLAAGGHAASEAESPTPDQRPATPPETPADPVARGRELHARVLARYPKVDVFYRKPFLWGSMTDCPLATISVPASDWASFSAEERRAVEAFAASLVDQVRSSPLEYANVSPSVPAAAIIRKRASEMDANSWGVMIGSLTPDGRDIQADSLVARGR